MNYVITVNELPRMFHHYFHFQVEDLKMTVAHALLDITVTLQE